MNEKTWLDEELAQEQKMEKLTFRQAISQLPQILMHEVIKRLGTAVIVTLVTIAMIILTKDWMYAVGFLLALLATYLGLDIIWKFGEGKILVARMLVCKSNRSLRQRNKYHVILRDASIEDLAGKEIDTFKYDLTVSARDIGNITTGTILDIFISEAAPHAILAYEILGEAKH